MDRDLFIKERTREIVSSLGFYDKKTSGTELENVIKTYKYVIQNIRPNPNYKEESNSNDTMLEKYKKILALALENNPGSPSTNTVLFHHLHSSINEDSYIVKWKSKNSGSPHICNLVRIGKQYYYFDPTLDRSILDERTFAANDLMLCAGMGKNEYEQLYTPVTAFRREAKKTKDTYTKNISEE